MESRRSHRSPIVVSTLILVALVQGPVGMAEEEESEPFRMRTTATVYTTSEAAVVEAEQHGAAAPSGSTKTRRGSCYLEPDTAPVTHANLDIYAAGRERGELSFNLYCDGEYIGLVWLPADPEPRGPVASPREVANQLREEIPMPDVTIRANPEIGLAGSESWFWIEGYSGEAVARSTDVFGEAVEVEATVSRYEWDFGDGKVITGSLGAAYPERSDVRHVYEKATGGEGLYTVTVRFVFEVRYRAGGGPWTDLPGISRTASASYQVRQSQAVIER